MMLSGFPSQVVRHAANKTIRKQLTAQLYRLYRRSRREFLKRAYKLPTVEIESLILKDISIQGPILDDICLPPYYAFDDHDDFAPLMKIIKSKQPGIVVELGTAYGNIAANICHQCPQTTIYTVNAPAEEQTGDLTTFELDRDQIGRVYRKYGFSSRVVQITKNTLDLDLSEYLAGQSIDIAVIDACHDTDYVLSDFFKVYPFMAARGIVLFHDTHPSMKSHLLGSYMACLILRQKGYDIRHIKDTWWGIWGDDFSSGNE